MRLPQIQTDHHGYALLEADNGSRWLSHLGLDASVVSNHTIVSSLISQLLQASPQSISGVVLDPEFGMTALSAKKPEIGVLWQLEQSAAAVDPLALPTFSQEWSIENIRNNLGLAKLELYYHPSEEKALQKKQLVAELYDFCQYQHIDFFLKLVIYSPTGSPLAAPDFQAAQLTAIQELRETCDILALQSPMEALAAATLTAELDIPWVVFSQDKQPYEAFKDQMRQACEAGAMGFLVGESVWQELFNIRRKDQGLDETSMKEFMGSTVRDRLIELYRILGECLAV